MGIGYINIDNLEEALVDFDVQEQANTWAKSSGLLPNGRKVSESTSAYSDNGF